MFRRLLLNHYEKKLMNLVKLKASYLNKENKNSYRDFILFIQDDIKKINYKIERLL